MRILSLDVDVHTRPPAPDPIRDALQALPGSGSVTVTVEAEDGTRGSGSIGFGRIAGAPRALAAVIEEELKPLVVGSILEENGKTYAALVRETEYHGTFGLAMFGIAAVDTALWDCLGRSLGVPCRTLWGAVHDRIPAYAMVGWLNYPDAKVREICAEAVSQGFPAVKIKVGYPTLREDIRRVETVRSAVGDDIEIMVDANQSLTVADAIRRGKAFADLGCSWWEEPIPADDVDGYARLAAAVEIPVATGENLYTPADFARFLRRDAVDILQPDLRRAGGPTGLLHAGRLAAAFGCPYASHGGGPVQLNVMACLPNAIYLETGLVGKDSPLKLRDGTVNLPDGPGFSWA